MSMFGILRIFIFPIWRIGGIMEEEKLTWAGIMQGFAESKRLIDEAAAFTREAVSELKASLAESNAAYEKRAAEQAAQTAAMKAEVAGIGASNGMFAEDVYYRALSRQKTFAGIHFDDVSDQFGGILKLPGGVRLQDQFDIVMLNDIAAAIIESKYRAREDDVEKLVEKKAGNFKTLFPAYKDFKIYLGLGALAFEDKAVKKARECGVGLLKRVGDTIEYAADWEVKAY